MALHDSSSSARFYPDVSGPAQPPTAHHDVRPRRWRVRRGNGTALTLLSLEVQREPTGPVPNPISVGTS